MLNPVDAKLAEAPDEGDHAARPASPASLSVIERSRSEAPEAGVGAWLGLLCGLLEGASRAVLLLPSPNGPGEAARWYPAARWPASPASEDDLSRLVAVAHAAAEKGRTVVRPHARADGAAAEVHDLAHPIEDGDQITGLVAIEVENCPEPRLPDVVRRLQTGIAYLPGLLATAPASRAPARGTLESALWLVGNCLEHDRFRGAATAVATDLAAQLNCARVGIGFVDGQQVKVEALSHSADFSQRMNLIRRISAAMDEAVDQRASVVFPAPEEGPVLGASAHEELAKEEGSGAACTVLLTWNDGIIGAITLERDAEHRFESAEVETLEDIAALLGPILELKRRDDRWLAQKAWASFRAQAGKLVGPGHIGVKAAAIAALIVFLYLVVATGTFRVTAPATLEGAVVRVAVAPIDGYIIEAPVRAGDLVSAGQVLCVLDDRDLRLEQRSLQSQRDQIESSYLEAMAEQERVEMNLLRNRMAQVDVQLDLVADQLARLHIVAPIDGLVVTGDLSQSIGAPVPQGEPLFEIAPLDSYRLMLKVDERDVAHVQPRQRGSVVLASLPETAQSFTVEKVTPVSTSEEGSNYFLVEASLDEAPPALRPGMEGIGKIDIEPRRRIWILTRRVTDWLRMWVWSWRGPGG